MAFAIIILYDYLFIFILHAEDCSFLIDADIIFILVGIYFLEIHRNI